MTVHNSENRLRIMVDGRPASTALLDLRGVAGRLVLHFAEKVVPCGALPGAQLQRDIFEVTLRCLRLGIRMLDEGVPPADSDLLDLRQAAAKWARVGFPLEQVLRIYHEGVKVGWDLVASKAREGDLADVLAASRLLVTLLERVTTAAATAYVAELEAVMSERDGSTVTLVTALLSGRNAASSARQAGLELADNYVVLAVAMPPHPDEAAPHMRRAVVARAKLGRVQRELAEAGGGSVLWLLSPEGGTLLVPGSSMKPWLEALLERIGEAAEVPVTATMTSSHPTGIPAAAEQAHELLDLVRELGSPPGLYQMADLALEYQITRPGPGRAHLALLLEPLQGSPELIETLEVHIGNDFNRQRTAKSMHLHANTVDYRLKRVAQLTGWDPTRPSGLRHIQAALIARRLEATQPGT